MTFVQVYLLSAAGYIVVWFLTYIIAKWIAKKIQYELKTVEAGLLQSLGLGFLVALVLGSLTAGYTSVWMPVLVFTFCYLGFGLFLGLLWELETRI